MHVCNATFTMFETVDGGLKHPIMTPTPSVVVYAADSDVALVSVIESTTGSLAAGSSVQGTIAFPFIDDHDPLPSGPLRLWNGRIVGTATVV